MIDKTDLEDRIKKLSKHLQEKSKELGLLEEELFSINCPFLKKGETYEFLGCKKTEKGHYVIDEQNFDSGVFLRGKHNEVIVRYCGGYPNNDQHGKEIRIPLKNFVSNNFHSVITYSSEKNKNTSVQKARNIFNTLRGHIEAVLCLGKCSKDLVITEYKENEYTLEVSKFSFEVHLNEGKNRVDLKKVLQQKTEGKALFKLTGGKHFVYKIDVTPTNESGTYF